MGASPVGVRDSAAGTRTGARGVRGRWRTWAKPRVPPCGPAGAAVERRLLHRNSMDTPPRVRGKVARVPRAVMASPPARRAHDGRKSYPIRGSVAAASNDFRRCHHMVSAPFVCLAPRSSVRPIRARAVLEWLAAPVPSSLVRPSAERFDRGNGSPDAVSVARRALAPAAGAGADRGVRRDAAAAQEHGGPLCEPDAGARLDRRGAAHPSPRAARAGAARPGRRDLRRRAPDRHGDAAVAVHDDRARDRRVAQHAGDRRRAEPARARRRLRPSRSSTNCPRTCGSASCRSPGRRPWCRRPPRAATTCSRAIDRFQLQRATATGSGLLLALSMLFPDEAFDLEAAVFDSRYSAGPRPTPLDNAASRPIAAKAGRRRRRSR